MRLPLAPPIKRLQYITPTIYETALKCVSRAVWPATGEAAVVPAHPRALLGMAFHSVMEAARLGAIAGSSLEEKRSVATRLFDEKMGDLFSSAHALLRVKFEAVERLPYYHMHRARAAGLASAVAVQRTPAVRQGLPSVEARLQSRDGAVVGRPDFIDRQNAAVVDYKTGGAVQSTRLSEAEERQLRLYAFLATENGVAVQKGVVTRADGRSLELSISTEAANAEGCRAREVLERINRQAGRPFKDAASPSAQNCQFCPCIAFCDAFWEQARPDWAASAGLHVEGEVSDVKGEQLLSVAMVVKRGTGQRGPASVSRLSSSWLTSDGFPLPARGDTIRIVDVSSSADTPGLFRADRIGTVAWRVTAS